MAPPRLPQMPAYHLVRKDHSGITMINIGVGPANAKTITDHIAVLRPHAWIMLGHCAGLRNTQQLGDYVLAHGYVREDHVLDEELPLWVPIPALSEIQLALEKAVADVTGLDGPELKTITDHVAVLRPHAWMMLGHCAGLRQGQQLGDYVLAHAYVREDHVLDEELPLWVPIPALSEIQLALEKAVADVTGMQGTQLKKIMRTGTVASTDNRNWELLPGNQPQRRFSQSRAVALDMESATIAANGFRFRVPYGTLLCVSDKPLHGEIKLPGMANHFYRERVEQHLRIGMAAIEVLRREGSSRLHSRKLRSFAEVAFQ